jgi:hypothetical protein
LIAPVVGGALPYHANPKFQGSLAIGGAGADFIIGGAIFELKTLGTLNIPAVRDALLQLIGYTLLDYDDEYKIRQVGVYASRQQWVTAWPIWQFIFPLGDVVLRLAAGTEPTEDEVTQRLAMLRPLMRTVVDGGAIPYGIVFA